MTRRSTRAAGSLLILAAALTVVAWGIFSDAGDPRSIRDRSRAGFTDSALGKVRPYPLPESETRNGIELRAQRESALEPLAAHVGAAQDLVRRWTGLQLPDSRPAIRYLYLCRTVETLLSIERHHDFESVYGFLDSAHTPGRTFEPRGGFYAPLALVILLDRAGSDAEWNVPHEITHAIVEATLQDIPAVLNEGLAEVIAPAALYAPGAEPGDPLPLDLDVVQRSCDELERIEEAGVLSRIFGLDYWGFRDARHENLYFELSTSLMILLLTEEHPQVAGRVPRLFERLPSSRSSWTAFRATYSPELVERLWAERVKEWRKLPWRKATGKTWLLHGHDWIARQHEPGLSVILRDEELGRAPLRLELSLDALPEAPSAAGIALGGPGPDEYLVFAIQSSGQLTRMHYSIGQWKLRSELPSPEGLDPRERWALEWNPRTREVVWRIGEHVIHRENRDPAGTRVGLYFESLLEPGMAGVRDARFRDVTFER